MDISILKITEVWIPNGIKWAGVATDLMMETVFGFVYLHRDGFVTSLTRSQTRSLVISHPLSQVA